MGRTDEAAVWCFGAGGSVWGIFWPDPVGSGTGQRRRPVWSSVGRWATAAGVGWPMEFWSIVARGGVLCVAAGRGGCGQALGGLIHRSGDSMAAEAELVVLRWTGAEGHGHAACELA